MGMHRRALRPHRPRSLVTGRTSCAPAAQPAQCGARPLHAGYAGGSRQARPLAPIIAGGQQALATLALSFSLQAAYPSPFYFFDEIDCALDTGNAGRVSRAPRLAATLSPSPCMLSVALLPPHPPPVLSVPHTHTLAAGLA
jgi:hypothetical protein